MTSPATDSKARPGRRAVAVAGGDDEAAEPRAERVRDVERGVVHRRAEGLRVAGDVHQPQLEVDHEHRAEHVMRKTTGRAAQPCGRREPEGSIVTAMPTPPMMSERKIDQSAMIPASPVPTTMPRPKASRKTGDRPLPQPGDVGDDGRDVGVDGEHAAEADGAGQQGEPHLRHRERRQLAATARLGVAGARRHEPHDEGERSPPPGRRRPSRRAPAERPGPSTVAAGTPITLATESPSITGRPRGPCARAGHARRHEGGDAEVGAVRQPGGEAGDHQLLVGGRERAQRRCRPRSSHQGDQQAAPRQTRAEEGQERRTDDHADGVRRDDVAAGRDRDVDAARRSAAAGPS